jgi:hypothetical protein
MTAFSRTVVAFVLMSSSCVFAADAAKPITPQEREKQVKEEAKVAIKAAVEKAIEAHPDISADLKSSLRNPALHDKWIQAVEQQTRQAAENGFGRMPGNPIAGDVKEDLIKGLQVNAIKELTEGAVEDIITRSLDNKKATEAADAARKAGKQPPPPKLPNIPNGNQSAGSSYTYKQTTKDGVTQTEENRSYKVNGKEVSRAEYDRARSQMASLMDQLIRAAK